MLLTVLSDSDINSLLLSLTKDDIIRLQHNLAEALHDYSTGNQETTAGCSTNQPMRISIPAADSQTTTLCMPASTSTSRGIKVVSLATAPVPSPLPSMTALALDSPRSSSLSDSQTGSRSSTPPPQSPSTTNSRSSIPSIYHSTSITSNQSSSPSISSIPSNPAPATTPTGCLTLLTPPGNPYAFLAAQSLTAFRTALASTILFNRRTRVHSITVFGAGAQARWHIRLALLLRGPEIHHVDIINRSFQPAKKIMHDFYTHPSWASLRDANPKLQFSIVSTDYTEYAALVKEHLRKADVVFCCTPSTSPLFPHEILTSSEGRRKGRYISAIGSYKPYMLELHPEILRQAVRREHKHHHHRHADKGGVIVVDSLEACLKEAGEVIQAGLSAEQLVEVGELIMVKKAAVKEIEEGTGKGEKGLREWLDRGNVLYKSVGLGIMDVCVGEDLVVMAGERGVGTRVEGF